MTIKDISFSNAEENILYDESLLESAENGSSGEALRFWEAEEFFIVLGKISSLEDDIKLDAARKDNIKIVRRASGGGTVLQGPGCLNYSFILSYERVPALKNIRKSYESILGKVSRALKKLNIDAVFEPISDIAAQGRKFSGNAQHRRKRFMLHHGTILYNFPLEKIERYLALPKEQPPYRKDRNHRDFLMNINVKPDDIKEVISGGVFPPTQDLAYVYTGPHKA